MDKAWCLREVGAEGRRFLPGPGDNVVGSAPSCAFQLDHRGISRRHAVIQVDPDGCRVSDLGSKNGTRVNGEAVEHSRLQLGDEIAFGATVWRLETVDQENLELAVSVEPPTGHGSQRTHHEETLPLSHDDRSVSPPWLGGMVECVSPAMREVYRQIEILHQGDVPLLMLGETGVGKEHLARAVHDGSARHQGPFIAINCAALPADLLEAELFGIGRGVATGVAARPGKIVQASGGTLFLDEVGELAPDLQAKLLRVLQESEVSPLGETVRPVDVRFLAATNLDLQARASAGEFRSDLYYRLAGYSLTVPPLRERPEDIRVLAGFFLRRFSREVGKSVRGLTIKALEVLEQRPWPGNVRELSNVIRRLVYRSVDGQAIDSDMLLGSHESPEHPLEQIADRLPLGSVPLADYLETLERRLVERAMAQTNGNRSQAARLLGVSRNGLRIRLRRLAGSSDELVSSDELTEDGAGTARY